MLLLLQWRCLHSLYNCPSLQLQSYARSLRHNNPTHSLPRKNSLDMSSFARTVLHFPSFSRTVPLVSSLHWWPIEVSGSPTCLQCFLEKHCLQWNIYIDGNSRIYPADQSSIKIIRQELNLGIHSKFSEIILLKDAFGNAQQLEQFIFCMVHLEPPCLLSRGSEWLQRIHSEK